MQFRGWIISELNNIEFFIEMIIINSFFKSSQKIERELFKENVLKQRFCGLWEKRTMLRSIQKSKLFTVSIVESELSVYRGNLQKLIEARNKLGHNQISIEIPSIKGILKCSKDGKEIDEELTEAYLNELKELHNNVLSIV